MKRIFILVLLAVFLLTACGSPSAMRNKETVEPIKSQSEITTSFKVGNFIMTLPEGYTAEENSTNSYFISSDNSCCMAIFAKDVSLLDESHVNQLVNSFKGLYKSDDCTIYGERITQVNFAGTVIDMLIYVEEDTSGDASLTIEGSFTDSWFVYSIMVTYPVNDANTDVYAKSFGQFCYDAAYTGNTPRFDFVKFENNDAAKEYPGDTGIPTATALEDIPQQIYLQTGEENGLIGTNYFVQGTVTETGRNDTANYFIVNTPMGDVLISDMSETAAMNSESLKVDIEQLLLYYPIPKTGEYVKVLAEYQGMSGEMEMPLFLYATTDYLYAALALSIDGL